MESSKLPKNHIELPLHSARCLARLDSKLATLYQPRALARHHLTLGLQVEVIAHLRPVGQTLRLMG